MKFSKEEKAMWLEDWRKSGKGAWAYAKENGLIPQTFCSWVKRAVKKETGFAEISMQKVKPKLETPQEILIEKGEIKIHIPLSVWAEGARVILDGLKEAL